MEPEVLAAWALRRKVTAHFPWETLTLETLTKAPERTQHGSAGNPNGTCVRHFCP